jgi:hypothetical protein
MKIKPLILNNLINKNSRELYACENDIKLIYYLFYNFYKKNTFWEKPKIIDIDNKIINNDNYYYIIYFSGHSNKNGEIIINDKKYTYDYFSHLSNIYFILDCCYSARFLYNNINKKKIFLLSCNEEQTSKEIYFKYNDLFKKANIDYDKINTLKKNIGMDIKYKVSISVFTYYLTLLLLKINNDNIFEWKSIIDNPLWVMVENKYNQTIFYKEYI